MDRRQFLSPTTVTGTALFAGCGGSIGVLDGKLATGQYSKIELYVSDVEGIVGGESVPVKVPSNNLLPVISKSGVAGEDVDVEEVDADNKQPTESGTATDA